MALARRQPRRVVVADDEPDVRFLVRRLLSPCGEFQLVGEAAHGREAVEMAERLQPDVMLLDLMMPEPGDQALPHILRVAPLCMVAVFSGAEASDEEQQRLLDMGAFAYFEKSRSDQLVEMLEADYKRFCQVLEGEKTVPTWLNRKVG